MSELRFKPGDVIYNTNFPDTNWYRIRFDENGDGVVVDAIVEEDVGMSTDAFNYAFYSNQSNWILDEVHAVKNILDKYGK
jgi:hypothetical protein